MAGGRLYLASKASASGTRRPRVTGRFRRYKKRPLMQSNIARTIKSVVGRMAEKRKYGINQVDEVTIANRAKTDVSDANWYFDDITPIFGSSLINGNKCYIKSVLQSYIFTLNGAITATRPMVILRFIVVSVRDPLSAAVEIFGVPTINNVDSVAIHCPIIEYQHNLKVLCDKTMLISTNYDDLNPVNTAKFLKVYRKVNHYQTFNDDASDTTSGRWYYIIAKACWASVAAAEDDGDVKMVYTHVWAYNDI